MQDNPITNQHLDHLESLFVRYGAVPTELNSRNRALLGERQIYARNGRYYRAGIAVFEGSSFLIISTTDNEKFASVGIMEDIDALPLDLDQDRMEKAVRYALGVEPYPEQYPDY